jgi:hypothetical protein
VNRGVICAFALIASASPAAAQNAIQFFPRYDFHLTAEHLSSDDVRFAWDTNFGGDLDFVDYGRGRTTFAANYEAMLGDEFRRFDPNQGNYMLDVFTSLRGRSEEVAAQFRHTSRHLSDRFKRNPIDWNLFGISLGRDAHRGGTQIRAQGDLLGVLLKSNVDYSWEANGGLYVRVPVRPHISAISTGTARLVAVDGTRSRGTQRGARGEVGLRFEGQEGAVEVIVAVERRIDAYPLENSAMRWFSAGFRFVSR